MRGNSNIHSKSCESIEDNRNLVSVKNAVLTQFLWLTNVSMMVSEVNFFLLALRAMPTASAERETEFS